MRIIYTISFPLLSLLLFNSCSADKSGANDQRINIIIDTDANNELDDQHALAYAFCNADDFNIIGVTVNSTRVGDGIEGHYREAVRITKLCKAYGIIPIKKGAEGTYASIQPNLRNDIFDGKEAVDFIIEQSKAYGPGNKLNLVAVGKLTNVALAIARDSTLVKRVKVLWLGSNYPDPGEYNLENDTSALNPVFQSGVEIDIALVAYGRTEGTDAVKMPISEIEQVMPGQGPEINDSIMGRNGGYFNNFGDYAVNLWQNIELYGEEKTRSLYDLAALVVLKKPKYAKKKTIDCPYWKNGKWDPEYSSAYDCGFFYDFKKDFILNEFFTSLEDYELVKE